MFGLGDDAPCSLPGLGSVMKLAKQPLLVTGLFKPLFSCLLNILTGSVEAFIFGKSDNIIDLVLFAPQQHFMATKSAVTAKDDFHPGPDFAQLFDQQRKDCPRMFGTINLTRAKVADQ